MDISSLKYDPESDYWVADTGERFIKNVFREESPIWILAGSTEWRTRYQNVTHILSWPPQLPEEFSSAARLIVHQRMKKRCPSSLQKYDLLLNSLARIKGKYGPSIDLVELSAITSIELIWAELNASDRITFREFYRNLTDRNLCGATRYVADRITGWKARNDIQTLRAVLQWDPDAGALSTSELEVLRRVLEDPTSDQTAADHFVRVSLRIFLATLRRPSQILQIPADGFREINSAIGSQFFLNIPKVKAQAGESNEWECIPASLAKDIQNYRARPNVQPVCQKSGILLPHIVWGCEEAELSTAYFNSVCKAWFSRQAMTSPRTKRLMAFATTRLRHTGATQLAMQGYSRQLIQDVLQHDSPQSAQAYIDSVGADTLPLFEQMSDRLGSRFSDLKNAWFQGRIIDTNRSAGPPIIVPGAAAPAVVGACGSASSCQHHPLFSCYLCQYFLAFRQANHMKALDFIEHEYQRWRDTEIGASRSKAMKDFERTAAGIQDVMDRIDREMERDKA
ncbi:site-specific integrase [Magnetospirillum sulfuroxidans]|uniref:Site-specific integrase n=1 Tax=Magnetospirillum sulfuroxidans TaxID=611300 RepID=A0ABS5IES5_9PROT|nr:site-specific integrase [Magnetospirillum sulfuroxidans]MBR9972913.1 site-specific integrase [Magnetospirillum sulfuroxidans]